jgi:hypothetical protein
MEISIFYLLFSQVVHYLLKKEIFDNMELWFFQDSMSSYLMKEFYSIK